jgi:hypothetical protein
VTGWGYVIMTILLAWASRRAYYRHEDLTLALYLFLGAALMGVGALMEWGLW